MNTSIDNISINIYWITGIVILAVFYAIYAGLIKKRNNVKETLSGIDVQLTKRHDLIPNVLTIAKKYMEHERGVMEEITKLRSSLNGDLRNMKADEIKSRFAGENALQEKMTGFFARLENYPDLKAAAPMQDAIAAYRDVEDNISAARRFYNSSVTILNNSCETFPISLIAALVGIKSYPFYEASEEQKKPVSAEDFLK